MHFSSHVFGELPKHTHMATIKICRYFRLRQIYVTAARSCHISLVIYFITLPLFSLEIKMAVFMDKTSYFICIIFVCEARKWLPSVTVSGSLKSSLLSLTTQNFVWHSRIFVLSFVRKKQVKKMLVSNLNKSYFRFNLFIF